MGIMSALDVEDRPETTDEQDDPNVAEFQRLKREINAGQRHRSKWRIEAKRSYNFVSSKQWEEEDERILMAQGRPTITFNRTAPIINAVCGLEVNNRQGVVYLPREMGDVGVNEMYTSAGKWVREECQAEDEESEAFRDVTICGEGWVETRMDYDETPTGMVAEERIYPLEMGVNKEAFRANYSDARLIYRIRQMSPDDVTALLGLPQDIIPDALHARWLTDDIIPEDGGTHNKKDYPDETRDGVSASQRGPRRTVTVVQCQYWKRERVHLVATDADQQPQMMTVEEFAKFQERAAAAGMMYNSSTTTRKRYYECFIGNGILGEIRPLEMGFQFKAMTGMRDNEAKCFYGMVRDMFDPQMWANKWLSQTMHIMNTNAKGGLLAETDAFVNTKKAERDWSDPRKIVWVKPGSLQKQKVKERTPAPLPAGLEQLMMFAISSIRDVTGVNLELLGQADREQAASLEAQRRQSAMTVLAAMFDSLRRFRKNQGKLMLKFINLLPEGTLIRVLEKGQHKYIPLTKVPDVAQFDVIIDQAPSSPDQKQYIWAITAQILQMQILPPAAIIELLKYSPYPESVVAEIRKALGVDGDMPPDQLQQKLQQAEQALQMLEEELKTALENNEKAEDDQTIELLKIQIDEYKANTERLQAQWDARIKMAGAIATGERTTADTPEMQQTQPLDVGTGGLDRGGNEEQLTALTEQVGQLTQMMAAMMQHLGGQQQQEPVAPVDLQAEPPQGEM
jgi:hypothetical protein